MKRTPLKKMSERRMKEREEKKGEHDKMMTWFQQIWDERQDEKGCCYCFVTKAKMRREIYREVSSCYDHVLEKQENQFPQYKWVKKNIIIVLPSVHSQKGMDITKTPKILAYKNLLLTMHELGILKD